MNLTVPAPKLGGWTVVNWQKIVRRVEKSRRRSQEARERADRIERQLAGSFTAKVFLWRQQHGLCPYCSQAINWASGWSVHHIIPKTQGGSDNLVNLQLLHPHCHEKLHAAIPATNPVVCPVKHELELEPAVICR